MDSHSDKGIKDVLLVDQIEYFLESVLKVRLSLIQREQIETGDWGWPSYRFCRRSNCVQPISSHVTCHTSDSPHGHRSRG